MIAIDLDVAQTIQAVAALVGAVFSGLAFLRANRAAKSASAAVVATKANGVSIDEVRHLTNSLSEKAQAMARAAGLAEGDLKGRKDQTEERRVEAEAVANTEAVEKWKGDLP